MTSTAVPSRSQSVVEFLTKPSTYADGHGATQVIETHISWVFLTARHAYKLKKPVRFEFLDFSTPDLRHRACLDEVRLNRRLAPDVYIGVLPITRGRAGSLELDGDGPVVDWVVQMRRLPAENALDGVLREGRLSSRQAQSIARHLMNFYARLPPKPISADVYRESLNRHIRANGLALLDSLPAEQRRIRRIQSSQLRYLNVEAELIDSRVTGGRVVEGHGDLRPEHVYLNGTPTVIDCIEFSDELRTVDIADELSFLSMECERLKDGGLGQQVLAEYQSACGDDVAESLLSFYRCYRALVRAKVAQIRRQQQTGGDASESSNLVHQYIDLAEAHAKRLGPPILLVVGGLMGSGKSTLAAKLAETFAIESLSTDHIRHNLMGSSEAPTGYGEGHYRPDMRSRVYDELFRQADERLKNGDSLVLDGTFLTCCLRDRAYDLGRRHGTVTVYAQCDCPRHIAYARIQHRREAAQSDSEARTELYDLQAQDLEPLWADEPAITVDTTTDVTQQIRVICAELKRRTTP
jgi:aminoglycoside phosphotransferase family enzyme/predicted kinase